MSSRPAESVEKSDARYHARTKRPMMTLPSDGTHISLPDDCRKCGKPIITTGPCYKCATGQEPTLAWFNLRHTSASVAAAESVS